ncbi:MAG: hypothetical protein ABFD89_01035 [Bryobacteraceae bacterium]
MNSSTDSNWKSEYDAPEGQIWVCSACGKSNRNRVDVGDESCFINALLCYDRGGALPWEAVEEQHKEGK